MPDASYAPKVYMKQGGDEQVVASGGQVNVESGGKVTKNLSVANITTAGAGTYTAAQLAGGVITRDPAGAARTDTTDTAAAIIPAMLLDNDGDSDFCHVINTADAAEAITIAGGTGVTVSNAGHTIAQNESAVLLFRRTSATAVTVYVLGA
jgi:hypothetical protein